ncbi:MAG: hypothetical protein JSC188_000497 [Candidatus Tokpelaia sp. JSC188]|nr:MAG: hypothetical protein JSC188_000497 [Candidatus Tokpelaia sp. JSC188]
MSKLVLGKMIFLFSYLRLFHLMIICLAGISIAIFVMPAQAERVRNSVATFLGLDKITGRMVTFDIYINETYQFGTLKVTPRVCYTSSKDEAARVDGFVEVNEITLDQKIQRIFTGWVFADSPGLNAVEHPIYDIWLKNCK